MQKEEIKIYKQQSVEQTRKSHDSINESINALKEEIKRDLKIMNDSVTKKLEDKSFADAVKNAEKRSPTSLRTIIHEARNEEQKEDREKKARSNNVIIHGVAETTDDNAEDYDINFINQLFKDINCTIATTIQERIGVKAPLKKRPIKLTFKKRTEKEMLLNNLKLLKNVEKYKGMSVTEDFTKAERNLLSLWVEKAKEKNKVEPSNSNFVWRVRGSPRTTLFLKKLENREQKCSQ